MATEAKLEVTEKEESFWRNYSSMKEAGLLGHMSLQATKGNSQSAVVPVQEKIPT